MGLRRPRPEASSLPWLLCQIILCIAVWLATPATARAHSVGISRGDYRLSGVEVVAAVTFARTEVTLAVPELESEQVEATRAALAKWSLGGLHVLADGQACKGEFTRLQVGENDGLTLWLRYVCPVTPNALELDADFIAALSSGHRHLAHVSLGNVSQDFSLQRGQSSVKLRVPGGGTQRATPNHGGSTWARFRSFFVMGIDHILTGYDHLLFLVGLLLVLGPIRSLVGAITTFTIAHSLTLSLATFGIALPRPSVIEPLIALSITYVGIENWFVRDAVGRWRVTFCFGLIHGFGFAGALREISLPRPEVPLALFSFNLGVEAGQLAVVAVVLPALLFARHRGWLPPRTAKLLSIPVAAMGVFWFVARLFS